MKRSQSKTHRHAELVSASREVLSLSKNNQRQIPKPVRDDGHLSLADRVANRIAKEHVQPRSATSIWIEQLGYVVLAVVIFAVATLLINWVGFQIRAVGIFEFTRYGRDGYVALLEALPYGFLLLCLLGLAATVLAVRHFDISYRKPLWVTASILLLSLGLGTIMATSGVNERLAEQADQAKAPPTVVHRLYRGRLTAVHHSTRLIIGPVIEQQANRLRIGLPPQRAIDVTTTSQTQYPTGKPTIGDQVRILVVRQGNLPVARVILLAPSQRSTPQQN